MSIVFIFNLFIRFLLIFSPFVFIVFFSVFPIFYSDFPGYSFSILRHGTHITFHIRLCTQWRHRKGRFSEDVGRRILNIGRRARMAAQAHGGRRYGEAFH